MNRVCREAQLVREPWECGVTCLRDGGLVKLSRYSVRSKVVGEGIGKVECCRVVKQLEK